MVWFVVGIALALPAGLWLVQINMEEMTVEWQGRPGLSVYFELDASPERIYAVKRFLMQTPSVKTVKVTSAADANSKRRVTSGRSTTELLHLYTDHLGSANTTLNMSTGEIKNTRFYPFGEVRGNDMIPD